MSYPQYDNRVQRLITEFPEIECKSIYRPNPINTFRSDIIRFANQKHKRLIFIDTGIMKCDRARGGNKENYYQVGYDCIKGLGIYYNENMPEDRLNKLDLQLKPWREATKTVLLFGQLRFGIGSQHIDIYAWYRFCLRYLTEHRYKIGYLEHPNVTELFVHHKYKFKAINRESKYTDVGVALTFSSNACVDAIVNGVPTIAMSVLSPAYNVCSDTLESLENPKLFDRRKWLSDLAYTQWKVTEMENGECWNHLKPHAMKSPSALYPSGQRSTSN